MPMNAATAAEIYQVKPDYQRYNQKYNMTRQQLWQEDAIKHFKERDVNLQALLDRHAPGYTTLDWAFHQGAVANRVNTGFPINASFTRGNYWLPLATLHCSERAIPQGVKKWEGDPQTNSRIVAKAARMFGASQIGFCNIDRRWVYSRYFDEAAKQDLPLLFGDEPGGDGVTQPTRKADGSLVIPAAMKYCAVMIHEMDAAGMATAPTLTELATTMRTYSQISFSVVSLAEFIRGLGYHAIPSANDLALSIPLAIDAGLGELGRNAKLINPVYGPRCRISKVFTNLPLPATRPRLLGVESFCDRCGKCARACPAGAIPEGKRSFEPVNECNNRGVLAWQLDHKKCYAYFGKTGTNCGICIHVCPFNKPAGGIHSMARWSIKNVPALNGALIRADRALKFGRHMNPALFWKEN